MTRDPARSSDFTPIASRYDETRDIPAPILSRCYDRLRTCGWLPERGRILDIGCGTGQISLRLAEQGYEIRGFDVSRAMIALAQSKVGPEWNARYDVGDACALPVMDGSFDAAVASKIFMHIPHWQRACGEIIRALRPGSPLIHVRDRGAFGNGVRVQFAKKADALGYTDRFPGLDPIRYADLSAFMCSQGCRVVSPDMSGLNWDLEVRYDTLLDAFQNRLFAEFWPIPETIYGDILAETTRWVDALPHGRASVERLSPYLSVDVFIAPQRG